MVKQWVSSDRAAIILGMRASSTVIRRAKRGLIPKRGKRSARTGRVSTSVFEYEVDVPDTASVVTTGINLLEDDEENAPAEMEVAADPTPVPPPTTNQASFRLMNGEENDHVNVRIKVVDGVKFVSGVDLVRAATENTADYSAQVLRRLFESNPEVSASCTDLKFAGRGQRETPCFDGCVLLVNLLPGRRAAEWRLKSADLLVRYLGGDESLVSEIRRNRDAQEALAEAAPAHPARLFGETVERAQGDDALEAARAARRRRNTLELDLMEVELHERRAKLKEFARESELSLLARGKAMFDSLGWDASDRIFFKDQTKNAMRQIRAVGGGGSGGAPPRARPAALVEPDAVPNAQATPAPSTGVLRGAPVPMMNILRSKGLLPSNRDAAKRVAKRAGIAASRLLRTRFPNEEIPRGLQMLDGRAQPANCYYIDRLGVVEEAIESLGLEQVAEPNPRLLDPYRASTTAETEDAL